MFTSIGFVILISVWSFVYIKILVAPEGLFRFVPSLTVWAVTFGKGDPMVEYEYNYLQDTICTWLFGCPKCHAGIVSLVAYFFVFDYQLLEHFAIVVFTIFTTYIIERIDE